MAKKTDDLGSARPANEQAKGLPAVAWLHDRDAFEERLYDTGWRSIADAQHEGCEAFRLELVEALSELTTTAECLDMANESVAQYKAELSELRDVLRRNGFVKCDIGACNCGSYHARYGLPERMSEIKDALSDAGHPLSNDNGNLVSNALAGLIAERDASQAELAAMREQKPIAHQFQARDGEWYVFQSQKHYEDTAADGSWPIRAIYAGPVSAPSQVSAEVVQVPRADAESLIKAADVLIAKADGFSVSGVYFNEFDHNSVALITLGLELDTLRALLATSQVDCVHDWVPFREVCEKCGKKWADEIATSQGEA